MAPAFSLAVVLAFLLAVAQSVELTSSKGHFKFLLNGDLLAKAKAGKRDFTQLTCDYRHSHCMPGATIRIHTYR
jgi:hypothetical protein